VISHHMTVGANSVIFGYLVWYLIKMKDASSKRLNSHTIRNMGIAIACVAAGSIFLMLDPLRHVLLDHGGVIAAPTTLSMYSATGDLSFIGHTCQLATISGLCLLVVGLLWFTWLRQRPRALNGPPTHGATESEPRHIRA